LYLGALLTFVAGVSVFKPLRRLGFRHRSRAALASALGAGVVAAAALLPASAATIENHACKLDEYLPTYHFHEVHNTVVQAEPAAVYAAIKAVTPAEISGFRTLTWLRASHFGLTRPNLAGAPPDQPLLDAATKSGFLVLADQPSQEIVIGAIGFGPPVDVEMPSPDGFLKFDRPGYVKVAMNFTLAAQPGGGSSLFTETRAFATDAGARRTFGAYWRTILPGGSWVRGAWLRAIKARAER
jgi:hypothetical protein